MWKALLFVLTVTPILGDGKFPTRAQALSRIFPDTIAKSHTVYLTKDELEQAKKLAGDNTPSIVRYFSVYSGKTLMGFAILDTHRVRSKRESVLFGINNDGSLAGTTVLGFAEPRDFLPSPRWLKQFVGKRLNDELRLKKGIHGITGATLTSRAVTQAARRSLALMEVIRKRK